MPSIRVPGYSKLPSTRVLVTSEIRGFYKSTRTRHVPAEYPGFDHLSYTSTLEGWSRPAAKWPVGSLCLDRLTHLEGSWRPRGW